MNQSFNYFKYIYSYKIKLLIEKVEYFVNKHNFLLNLNQLTKKSLILI